MSDQGRKLNKKDRNLIIGLLLVVGSFCMLLGILIGFTAGAGAAVDAFDTVFDGASITFTLNETFLAEEGVRMLKSEGLLDAPTTD